MTYQEYLQTDHWKDVRKRALKWAGNKCQACASLKKLEVHHNTYNYWSEQKEDVLVLCDSCHHKLLGDKKAPPVSDLFDMHCDNLYPREMRQLFKKYLNEFVNLFGAEKTGIAANILEIKNL